jgi:predicted DNA binding CopG/RHH family protein
MDCMVQGKRVEIRLSPELIAAIDAWRRHLPDLPPRASAVVRLAEIGLEAISKKKAKPVAKK